MKKVIITAVSEVKKSVIFEEPFDFRLYFRVWNFLIPRWAGADWSAGHRFHHSNTYSIKLQRDTTNGRLPKSQPTSKKFSWNFKKRPTNTTWLSTHILQNLPFQQLSLNFYTRPSGFELATFSIQRAKQKQKWLFRDIPSHGKNPIRE